MFLAVDNGNLQRFKQLAQDPLVLGQNKCGHSMMHRALLSRRDDVVLYLVENFPHTVHGTDNVSGDTVQTVIKLPPLCISLSTN